MGLGAGKDIGAYSYITVFLTQGELLWPVFVIQLS